MPPLDPKSHDWFTQNLQPHEGMLRAWLRSRFGNDSEVDYIVQEAFVRVLKAGEVTQIDSPKALDDTVSNEQRQWRVTGISNYSFI